MATWLEAITQVLQEAKGALHYTDIAERILELQLRDNPGPTPAQTVASTLSLSLRNDADTPFQWVSRGVYTLKQMPADVALAIAPYAQVLAAEEDLKSEAGAIQAFGMFWERDAVNWSTGRPRLLGKQGTGAESVDFGEQVGIYLLHDRDRTVYVGRAGDTMHSRLRAHTVDRLNGRWDRFSWFGLRKVQADGALSDPAVDWTHEGVIETLEALLIECLEPPLNRRRGDNLGALEYLQVQDPSLMEEQERALLLRLLGNRR